MAAVAVVVAVAVDVTLLLLLFLSWLVSGGGALFRAPTKTYLFTYADTEYAINSHLDRRAYLPTGLLLHKY